MEYYVRKSALRTHRTESTAHLRCSIFITKYPHLNQLVQEVKYV